jgi:hypothetical protein
MAEEITLGGYLSSEQMRVIMQSEIRKKIFASTNPIRTGFPVVIFSSHKNPAQTGKKHQFC